MALVRSTALMIPAVTVLLRPRGLPMAMAHSPGLRLLELPRGATGSLSATTRTTAMSVSGSLPRTRPLKLRPSGSVTETWSAPSTTCAFVKISPSERVMNPDPWPACCWIGALPPKRLPSGFTTRFTVSIRTTEGPTRSTASTMMFFPG